MHMMLAPAGRGALPVRPRPEVLADVVLAGGASSGGTVALLMSAQLSILMTVPPSPDDADNPMRVVFSPVRNQAFCRRFGVDICTTCAMPETSGMGTLQAPGTSRHPPKIIRRPMPESAEIRVVAPDGTPVPLEELGELCFRHPDVMIEYHRDPVNTRATLRDGWVHSGDLGSMDAEGNAYFHGWLKNVVKRGGENVAGEEVEFTIMDHPAVEGCLVTGIEDEFYTEEVCAVVVVREGQRLTTDDVARWCTERLPSWKVPPRHLDLRSDGLPKLANGKTDRASVIGPPQDCGTARSRRELPGLVRRPAGHAHRWAQRRCPESGRATGSWCRRDRAGQNRTGEQ
jgi:crotonobetaine/carnitine-CoA ligase